MKRRALTLSTGLFAAVVLSAGILTTNCALMSNLLGLIALQLLGITPASDFGQTGNLNFNLLGVGEDDKSDLSGLQSNGLNVRVNNDDGTQSDCEFQGEDTLGGSEYNTLAILIDDSGSMEHAYPQDEYGDMCPTCPNDPERLRAEAARKLIERILEEAPQSRLALMDFGPTPSEGMDATRILSDFTSSADALNSAADDIDGSEMAGTPMWDSLMEIITATDQEAEDLKADLERTPQTFPGSDDNTEEVDVQRFIVVLGDGDDDINYGGSDDFTLADVIAAAQERNVIIHAVGLGSAAASNDDPLVKIDEQVTTVTNLQQLAEATGGYYASAADPEELLALYDNIARSMTQGYTRDTYSCRPRHNESDPEGEIPEPGEPIEGTVTLGSFSLPFRTMAPSN